MPPLPTSAPAAARAGPAVRDLLHATAGSAGRAGGAAAVDAERVQKRRWSLRSCPGSASGGPRTAPDPKTTDARAAKGGGAGPSASLEGSSTHRNQSASTSITGVSDQSNARAPPISPASATAAPATAGGAHPARQPRRPPIPGRVRPPRREGQPAFCQDVSGQPLCVGPLPPPPRRGGGGRRGRVPRPPNAVAAERPRSPRAGGFRSPIDAPSLRRPQHRGGGGTASRRPQPTAQHSGHVPRRETGFFVWT